MYGSEFEQEPDEFSRLVYLLAINEQMVNDLTEQYDSGTEAPPARVIESRLLPAHQGAVPPSAIAEYRAMLVRHGERLRSDIQQYKRVRMVQHDFDGPAAETEPTAKKSTRVPAPKKRAASRRTNV
jgi:hypothetical protein